MVANKSLYIKIVCYLIIDGLKKPSGQVQRWEVRDGERVEIWGRVFNVRATIA